MHKKNSFLFGLLIGLVLPGILYLILYLGSIFLVDLELCKEFPNEDNIQLISIFVNLFPIRYYFITLKYENTGRGVLLMTFVLGIMYFIIRLA